jgi:branched-chain amino acid aminotransferase
VSKAGDVLSERFADAYELEDGVIRKRITYFFRDRDLNRPDAHAGPVAAGARAGDKESNHGRTVLGRDGWTEENRPLLGLGDNSFWMGNSVFDGARAYEGVVPDLDLHCARALRSAGHMLMQPDIDAARLARLCLEASRASSAAPSCTSGRLFLRAPRLHHPEAGQHRVRDRHPSRARCRASPSAPARCRYSRRPGADMAPTAAKASCLYR